GRRHGRRHRGVRSHGVVLAQHGYPCRAPARVDRRRRGRAAGRPWVAAVVHAGGRRVRGVPGVRRAPGDAVRCGRGDRARARGVVPVRPGGRGFVEAGRTGTLTLAGIPAAKAVLATLAYRLVSYWLPLLAGPVAAVLHVRGIRRRRGVAARAISGSPGPPTP